MKSQGKQLLLFIIIVDLLIVLAIVGLRMIKAPQSVATQSLIPTAPTPNPGLVVYGTVRDMNGAGLENVIIYRSYASYPGVQIATTDRAGLYQSNFFGIPGDEMVSVWAESAGKLFIPASCNWRHYYGSEMRECSFVASSTRYYYLPIVMKSSN